MIELDEYRDAAFDVVVCLEALEHVEKQEALVAGIRRVFTEDGVLILSTPDRETYNAQIHEPNPFHVRELDRAQLLDLLGAHFAHTMLWGQSGVGGSRLAALDGMAGRRFTEELVERRAGVWVDLDDAAPPYLIAVASPSPVTAVPPDSYLLDPTAAALRERDRRLAAREARIRELKEENADLYRENERLRERSLRRRVRSMLARLSAGNR
jgi:SAM-dependent methyltransferase